MTIQSIIPRIKEQLNPKLELEKILTLKQQRFFLGTNEIVLHPQKLHIISIGKAAVPMLKAVTTFFEEKKLCSMIKSCVILDHLHDCEENWPFPVSKYQGDHPIPLEKTFEATQKVIQYLELIKSDEVCLFLISGGTSSLLEYPIEGLSRDAFCIKTESLFQKGMTIEELNRQRNLLSQIKQGRLLNFVKTDYVYNLIINDTPSENDQWVGSGPTVGIRAQTINWDNRSKLKARLESALPEIHWSLEEARTDWSELVRQSINHKQNKVGFIGEVSLSIPKQTGMGGRNTHFTAFLLDKLSRRELKLKSFLSLATDGADGNSQSAGAFFDFEKGIDLLGLEKSLETFDTASWLGQHSLLIPSFKSLTNLMDIRVYFL